MSPVRWGSADAAIIAHCREKMKLLTAQHWTASTGQEHPKRRRWGRKIVGVVCCSTLCFCRLHSLPVFGRLHVDVMSFFGDSCGRHFFPDEHVLLSDPLSKWCSSPRHLLFTSAVCFLMGWLDLNLSLILLFLFCFYSEISWQWASCATESCATFNRTSTNSLPETQIQYQVLHGFAHWKSFLCKCHQFRFNDVHSVYIYIQLNVNIYI